MKRVGIFGGTFDPPHYGHLIVAQEVWHACSLDEIWFMPSGQPPHKNRPVTDVRHRVKMIHLAIADHPAFRLSLFECRRRGPSYTYDTIKALKSAYPGLLFHFIIGGDMAEDLPRWHRARDLISEVPFISVRRPGYSTKAPFETDWQELEIPGLEISSTMLRRKFARGEPTRYYLPKRVRQYIEEHRLYD